MKYLLFLFFVSFAAQAREVSFGWDAFDNARAYQVQVSKSADFSTIDFKKLTKESELTTNLNYGQYFYRVRAIDQYKKPGAWSAPGEFQVKPYSPELTSPPADGVFVFFDKKIPMDFSWKPTEGKPEYEILITKINGKKTLEEKVATATFSVEVLPAGDYEWKVRSIYGTSMSDYSEARKFTVDKKPLQPAELLSPTDSSYHPAYRPVRLEWKIFPPATVATLDIEMLKPDGTYKKLKSLDKGRDSDAIFEKLEPGKYRWRIWAKEEKDSKGTASEWSEFRTASDIISGSDHIIGMSTSLQNLKHDYSSTRLGGTRRDYNLNDQFWVQNWQGRYQFTRAYSLALEMDYARPELGGQKFPYQRTSIINRFRFGAPGFQQSFIIGVRQTNTVEMFESAPGVYGQNLLTLTGPLIGTDLTGSLNYNLRLNIALLYYRPSHVWQNGVGSIRSDNYEARARLSWNFWQKFWLNYEIAYEKGIYYYNPGAYETSWSMESFTPLLLGVDFRY